MANPAPNGSSPLAGFTVAPEDLETPVTDLVRPECVVAEPDGTLWISDARGGLTHVAPGAKTGKTIGSLTGEPNGFSMLEDGSFCIANIGSGEFVRLHRDGRHDVMLSHLPDGTPLGSPNYAYVEKSGRIWASLSTRLHPWAERLSNPVKDGHILRIENGETHVVVDDIDFTNEVRPNNDGSYLYAAETLACGLARYKINADGSLGPQEKVVLNSLGPADFVDGFCFDVEGNIWITLVTRNGILVKMTDGSEQMVLEDPHPEGYPAFVKAYEAGDLQLEHFHHCIGKTVGLLASVNFGGPDLKTVYIGTLGSDRLFTFRSPVAGMPMPHWS